MKPLGLISILLAGSILLPLANAAPAPPDGVKSPEVLADGRVTFRLRAAKASAVSVTGDWMAPNTREAMTQGENGVWRVTLGPLQPGIAIYTFDLDGVSIPDPVNPRIKLRARGSASLVEVPGGGGGGGAGELWQPRDVPHGTVEVNWLKSPALQGQTRAVYVYTPPGYDEQTSLRYPVLYLLHGSNDTAAGWTDVGRAHFILDNLLAEGRAVPMIVVMPWGHAVPFDAPREAQSKNTALFEQYLLEDVLPQVERKYRAAPGRENRAVVGLSMGGGQALHIGLGHLDDRFAYVGAFSSAVPGDFEARFRSLLDDPSGTNAKLKLLWIGCGRQDSAFARAERLAALLSDHKIRHTFRPTEGRHHYAVWRQYLGEVAPLLFRADAKSAEK
jgi:enterochelin esterase-like enzyme